MNYIIFGKQSRLTKALISTLPSGEVNVIPRSDYIFLNKDKTISNLQNQVNLFGSAKTTIINCVGVTNPQSEMSQLKKWNIEFALELYKLSRELQTRYVTFGTVSETFLAKNNSNPYTNSKRELTKQFVRESSDSWLHIRLHTLYGVDIPSQSSFLGGIYKSLIEKTTFHMTSGLQLREYHHFLDDCALIHDLMAKQTTGLVDINADNAVKLKDLAMSLFSEFKKLDLLKIDSSTTDIKENLEMRFRIQDCERALFRDPISGVIQYFKSLEINNE